MALDPITVEVETPLTRTLQQMTETRCKSFPVLDHGRLAGVIAREDILRG